MNDGANFARSCCDSARQPDPQPQPCWARLLDSRQLLVLAQQVPVSLALRNRGPVGHQSSGNDVGSSHLQAVYMRSWQQRRIMQILTWKAPMCCVMPPTSLAATEADLSASSRDVCSTAHLSVRVGAVCSPAHCTHGHGGSAQGNLRTGSNRTALLADLRVVQCRHLM